MTTAQCAHDGCTCKPMAGSRYCGEQCAQAKQSSHCTCGHEACGGRAPS